MAKQTKKSAPKTGQKPKSGSALLVIPVKTQVKRGPARKGGKKVDPGKMSKDPFFG